MQHPFLTSLSHALATHHVATLRYQFPYMEQKRRAPDPPAVLMDTVDAAVAVAAQAAPKRPLFAGGKSMGGRMTSQAAARNPLPGVHGLVFFGFPLHPPGAPSIRRADHLANVTVPMLFLQGTRDTFADLKLLRPVLSKLGSLATLHLLDTADHSFHVLKSSKRTDADALEELAATTASWISGIAHK
jgi:predicted alpha/beta-hydrolase family hydrolase